MVKHSSIQSSKITRYQKVLDSIINGKIVELDLKNKLVELPKPIQRPLYQREEKFFAVSPDNPNDYIEEYDDVFHDVHKDKRSESFKEKALEEASKEFLKAIAIKIKKKENDYRNKDYFQKDNYDMSHDYLETHINESRYSVDYEKYYEPSYYRYDRFRERNRAEVFKDSCFGLLKLNDIVSAIDKQVSDKSNIKGIILFGDAAKITEKVSISKNKIGKRSVKSKGFNFIDTIHDIDILVLLKTDSKKKANNICVNAQSFYVSQGQGHLSYRDVEDGLDILAMTTNEYEDAIAEGGFMPKHIGEYGILLAGTFPYPLSESKIQWSRGNTPKWKPKKIVTKNSIKQKRKRF